MTDEELEVAISGAKKLVRQALVGTVLAVLIAAIVLGIDMGIKRAVIEEVANARGILDEFRRLADGAKAAGEAGVSGSGPVGAGDGVVHDAAPAAVLDEAGGAPDPAPGHVQAGVAGGPPGDG